METQAELLDYVVEALEELGIAYAIGGSIAAMAYGEPRLTRDIDILAQLTPADAERLRARFPAPEFYLDVMTAREAIRAGSEFNIIHVDSGYKIDLFVATLGLSRLQVEHARTLSTGTGRTARFTAPEDVILNKLRYYEMGGSDKHLRDIAAMLKVSGDQIDRARIGQEAGRLGLAELWTAIVKRVDD